MGASADSKALARRTAYFIVGSLVTLLIVLGSLWWSLRGDSFESTASGRGWQLVSAEMGSGDASVVHVEADGSASTITVAMAGDQPVSAECPEPRLQAVAVSGEPALVIVQLQWKRRGCETGPKQFTIRLADVMPPFRVLLTGDPCRQAQVESYGEFALTPATDTPSCT